jgi:uncharacterized repeat protein (TIGR01451 family)
MEYRATCSAPASVSKRLFSPSLTKLSLLLLFLTFVAGCATVKSPLVATESPNAPQASLKSFGAMPVYFIENRGEIDDRAAYYIRGKDKAIYFTSEGVAFSLARVERDKSGLLMRASYGAPERWLLKLDFVGARAVAPNGAEPTAALFSYFTGPKEEWKTGVKTYAKLVYADLWPGIDLVFSGTSGRLKYEFVVKPGADPHRVRLAYRGASSVRLDDGGGLEIATPAGGFRDDKPIAYQEIDGRRVDVPMAYKLDGETYGFRVGKYDRAAPLVLDPAILIYSGFIGGLGDDRANGIAVDGDGAAYVTGETESDAATFPETSGAFDRTQNGNADAFVAKVRPDGTGLVYATFVGGSGDDRGFAIAISQSCTTLCEAFVSGESNSKETTFPITAGVFGDTQSGGFDAFVVKVNADGTDLVYATFLGGTGNDRGRGIAVDGDGKAYVTGETDSSESSFPVSVGPFLTQSGGLDAFVARLAADATSLDYAGYIGGVSDDRGNAIALEPSCPTPCEAYVAGEAGSSQSTFPVTVGPDLTFNSAPDAFVAKVAADGSGLVYSGYIGGNNTDRANGIAVDSHGRAYVAGETNSGEANFPDGNGFGGGLNGFDQTQNLGFDAFLVVVAPDGSGLEYATYIGGSSDDRANAVAVPPGCGDALGACTAVVVVGETNSDQTTFPDKVGPDQSFNGGIDGFLAVIDTTVDGSGSLLSAGFIGGSGDDRANAVAADGSGGVYVAGESGALPVVTVGTVSRFTTKSGPDTSQNGGIDAFVAKFCTTVCIDVTLKMTASAKSIVAGDTITYNLTVTNKGPDDAHNVTVTDVFPAGAVFVPGSVECSPAGAPVTVTCALGTLAPGAVVLLTYGMTPTTGGSVTNTATVTSDETDTVPSNNSATIKTKVIFPDLVVKKLSLTFLGPINNTVAVGGAFNVIDTTSNNQAAPTLVVSTTAFYLSTDKTLDGGDTLLPGHAVPPFVGKGAFGPTTTGLIIPALTMPGDYYIIAVANDGGAVDEGGQDTNNTKVSKKFTVTP